MSQVVHHKPWFNHVNVSVKTAAIGAALFLLSFSLLLWNEGRAVKTDKALKERETSVIDVSQEHVDQANEDRIVHITGTATTEDELTDEQFGVAINAIRLERHVEMYQWQENKSQQTNEVPGGGSETVATFSYEKVWSDTVIDSGNFREKATHQNPTKMPFEKRIRNAANVKLGDFQLTHSLVQDIDESEPLNVSLDNVPVDVKRNLWEHTDARGVKGLSWSRWAVNDQIGDVHIFFSYTQPSVDVSVMATQTGNTFRPFTTKIGHQLCLLRVGHLAADEMISTANSGPGMLPSILRAAAVLMMFGGIYLTLKPLSVLADVVPLFGDLVQVGTGLVAALVTGTLSLLTVSSAWLLYRPLIGGPMLAASAGLAGLLFWQCQLRKTLANQVLATAITSNPLDSDEPQIVEETLGA